MQPPCDNHPIITTWSERRGRTLIFLLLAGLYVACHLIFRWLEDPLLYGDNCYYGLGFPWLRTIYLVLMSLLSVVAWGALIFLGLTRLECLTRRRWACLVLVLGLALIEADMRWFQLAKKHASLSDIQAFFDIDSVHLGLKGSDYWSFGLLIGMHAVVLGVLLLLAGPERQRLISPFSDGWIGRTYPGRFTIVLGRGCRWLADKLRVPRIPGLLDNRWAFAFVAGLVLLDPIIVWSCNDVEDVEESYSQWRDVTEANPLRWQSLDRWWIAFANRNSPYRQELNAVNAALNEQAKLVPSPANPRLAIAKRKPPPPTQPRPPDNVLFIQVESLSASVFAETRLPFLDEFSKKCLRLKRHFSTGNCTHYGVLGMLHGNPVTFFRGGLKEPEPCAYLEAFKQKGYSSRLIGMWLMTHHRLGDYLPNWTEPVFVGGDDWSLVPVFHQEIARPGPRFVYLFYTFTHFPYHHKPQYNAHQPEAGDDFAWHRSDLYRYREPIVNRYKNALLEFDDWLRQVLEKVDLSRTIVVITGDHGEELLEHGRIGHCASLNAEQTMTPCLIHIPGIAGGDIEFTTSHADLMPTVADALDLKPKPATMGRSLFEPVPARFAVVANFEYTRALRWVLVTDDRKAFLEEGRPYRLQIAGMMDAKGRRLGYRDQPERWQDTLSIIREMQSALNAQYNAR